MNNMAERQGCRWLWYIVFLVIVFWFFMVVWWLRRWTKIYWLEVNTFKLSYLATGLHERCRSMARSPKKYTRTSTWECSLEEMYVWPAIKKTSWGSKTRCRAFKWSQQSREDSAIDGIYWAYEPEASAACMKACIFLSFNMLTRS